MLPFDLEVGFRFGAEGKAYFAVFQLDKVSLPISVFSFAFNIEENSSQTYKSESFEEKLKEVLEYFLPKAEMPITFICDSSDGRQAARARLFHKWYSKNVIEDLMFEVIRFGPPKVGEYIGVFGTREQCERAGIIEIIKELAEIENLK